MSFRRFAFLGVAAATAMSCTPYASARQTRTAPPPGVICPSGTAATMSRVNDHWIAQNPSPKGVAWTTGAYFVGDMAAYRALHTASYLSYAQKWAASQRFALKQGATDTNANDQAVGQTYIELYETDPKHPVPDIAEIDRSVATRTASPTTDDWWWIDALFMAMPDFAKLAADEGKPAYLAKMYSGST